MANSKDLLVTRSDAFRRQDPVAEDESPINGTVVFSL